MTLSKTILDNLHFQFPIGSRVKLLAMDEGVVYEQDAIIRIA